MAALAHLLILVPCACQARAQKGVKNYIPTELLPDFLNFIIWGHEHECRIRPEEATLSLCLAPYRDLAPFALRSYSQAPMPPSPHGNLCARVLGVPFFLMCDICDVGPWNAEDGKTAHLTQPGSTVQTSLIAVEAEPKHMVRSRECYSGCCVLFRPLCSKKHVGCANRPTC